MLRPLAAGGRQYYSHLQFDLRKWGKMRARRVVMGLLLAVGFLAGLLSTPVVGAEEPAPSGEVGRYVEYEVSGSDRNDWRATVPGEVQFYNGFRHWKIFGEATLWTGGWTDSGGIYVRIKQNIANTTQDGRWYGLCGGSLSVTGDIPCDRYLDCQTQYCGGNANRTFNYWIGSNNSGEYFSFTTRPGRWLRGLWIRVCHAVAGPDVCGAKDYAPNPYIPQ